VLKQKEFQNLLKEGFFFLKTRKKLWLLPPFHLYEKNNSLFLAIKSIYYYGMKCQNVCAQFLHLHICLFLKMGKNGPFVFRAAY